MGHSTSQVTEYYLASLDMDKTCPVTSDFNEYITTGNEPDFVEIDDMVLSARCVVSLDSRGFACNAPAGYQFPGGKYRPTNKIVVIAINITLTKKYAAFLNKSSLLNRW